MAFRCVKPGGKLFFAGKVHEQRDSGATSKKETETGRAGPLLNKKEPLLRIRAKLKIVKRQSPKTAFLGRIFEDSTASVGV